MRFFKEFIIMLIIIIFVICSEFIINMITEKSLEEISEKIEELEESFGKESDLQNKIVSDLNNLWKERESKLSFYMEHNELEKISIIMTNLKTNIEYENMEEVYENIDEIKFRIVHIKNKQKLEMKNIF